MTHRWARPGELLGYAERLKQEGRWPPGRGRPVNPPRDAHPATGFLVIPAIAGDQGQRPVPGLSWLNSPSLALIDTTTGQPAPAPRKGVPYAIRATVQNLGAAPVIGGFCEFLVQDGWWIVNQLGFKVGAPEDVKHWLGVLPVSLASGESRDLLSPRTFTPVSDRDLTRALVARVSDPLGDKVVDPWDSWIDRHIARRDLTPDFAGIWQGTERRDGTDQPLGTIRLRIDRVPGMQQKASFKGDDTYASGGYETAVSIQSIPALADRAVNPAPMSGVQYSFGTLSFACFSTDRLDAHATMTRVTLSQSSDGQHLQMKADWGPNQLSTTAGRSHAQLDLIQAL